MIKIDLITIISLLGAFQGLFLLVTIGRTGANARKANRTLSILILITSISLLGRISYAIDPAMIWQSVNHLFVDSIMFVFGPLIYMYVARLISANVSRPRGLFLPLIMYIATIIFLILNPDTLYYLSSKGILPTYHLITQLLACLLNIYWLKLTVGLIRKYKLYQMEHLSFDGLPGYVLTLVSLVGALIVSWCSSLLLPLFGVSINISLIHDIVWILLSMLPYVFGYFALTRPTLFNVSLKELNNAKRGFSTHEIGELKEIGKSLEQLMENDKPYLNPDLTLSDLAKMIETNRTILSQVINTVYDKNFFDFINEYRIKNFITLVNDGKGKHLTFSALAYDAGFNTRTTFYKAFKKVTGTVPKEYFKNL